MAETAAETLQRTPLYELHRGRGASWCRSPAMRCRCSTRRASSPSICTPAPRPGSSTSRIWARSRLRGAGAAAALEALVPGDLQALAPMRHALHAASQRRRRHPRRSDGDARRRRPASRRQRRAARTPTSRICARRLGTARRDRAAVRPRAAGAAGAERGRGRWRASRRARRHAVHDARPTVTIAGTSVLRHPLRLHRRGRVRDLGRRRIDAAALAEAAARRARGRADRSRRARLAAARSRALPLRPRHRRDDDPDRGRTRLDDRQAPPRRGRLSRRRRDPARSSPRAPPRKRVGIRPDGRAPAREDTAIVDAAGDADRRGHQRRLRPVGRRPDRDGLCRRRPCRRRHRRSRSSCAACRGPARVVPLPFVPHRYYRG